MPQIKGKRFQYTEEEMKNAIEDVLRGMPTATAAKKHKVPRVTLLNKVKGQTPRERRMGPSSVLPQEHEKILVRWIIDTARAGFPISKIQLINSVQKIASEFNIKNPFKNNRPGKKWFISFLKRNHEISRRIPQNLTLSRSKVTKDNIVKWHNEVHQYLKDIGQEMLLDDPSRIFNADETAFFLNPKGEKVLAAKGDKSIYMQVNTDEKECLTVLITGSASGQIVDPMIIFKYARIPKDLALSIPQSWGIGRSESGWMTGQTFFEFISNIFDKWLISNGIQKPVILFIDGHSSHLTLHTSNYCKENGIILVALFPNATHLIQPMDVSVFRSLKQSWRSEAHQWRLDNIQNPILKKINFPPLLNNILKEKISPEIVKNGFKKCGLYPWDNSIYDSNEIFTKCTKVVEKKTHNALKDGLSFIENYIDNEKVNLFKKVIETSGTWNGNLEDLSLFNLYKQIRNDMEKQSQNISKQSVGDNSFLNCDESFNNIENSPANVCNTLIDPSSPPLASSSIRENDYDAETIFNPLSNENCQPDVFENTLIQPSTSDAEHRPPLSEKSNIPTPFKRILFWPEKKEIEHKKRRTEKVPAVVSSELWQLYHKKKDDEKQSKIDAKQKRAEELKKKRINKEKNSCGKCKKITKNGDSVKCDECKQLFHVKCIPATHQIHIPQDEDLFTCHLCYKVNNTDTDFDSSDDDFDIDEVLQNVKKTLDF